MKTEIFAPFSTEAGERGDADAERDIRGFAAKFPIEKGNWVLVGNNTQEFFMRDPPKFPDLNHKVDRDYLSQPVALFRLMKAAQKQVFFDNTTRAMGEALRTVRMRHIVNSTKVDPAYRKGVAKALKLPMK